MTVITMAWILGVCWIFAVKVLRRLRRGSIDVDLIVVLAGSLLALWAGSWLIRGA